MTPSLAILPFSLILLFLGRSLCRRMRSLFTKQTGIAATRWTRCLTSRRERKREKLPAFSSAKASAGQQTECAVCLCVVEEGDEFPELTCRHVFHSTCLDEWFDHGKETCPLCRVPLVPPVAESDDDAVPDDVDLPLSALFHCSFFRW